MPRSTAHGLALLLGILVLGLPALGLLLRPSTAPPQAPTPTSTPRPTATPRPTPSPTPLPTPTSTPTPTPTPRPSPTPTPTPTPLAYRIGVLGEGEALEEAAARWGSSAAAIRALNRFAGDPPPGVPFVVPLWQPWTAREGAEVDRGPRGRGRVALTFDGGGPADPAPRILEVLREHDLRVTIFLTGRWAEEHPDLVRQMVREGHELGNHTYGHLDLRTLEDDQILDEFLRTEAILRDLAGVSSRPFFRPPFGARDGRVLALAARAGYLSVYWTLDSLDSVPPAKTVDDLVARVADPNRDLDGAIVLLHLGSPATAEALPRILEALQGRGYEIVTVSELLYGP